MIGVDGQYLFRFKLGDRDDFINEEDLHIFKLHEEAGNVLPTFILSFDTLEDEIMRSIHEGNDLQVSFGKDRNSMIDIPLVITQVEPVRSGDSKRTISIMGMMSVLPYLNTDNIVISTKKSGVEVLKDTVGKYFNTSMFNITKSADSMNWIQSSQPDRHFVNHLWMHSDVTNSFIAVGISSDKQFILKDVKKALKDKFKWRFTNTPTEDNDISYDGDFVINLNSGFVNNWVGYPREKLVYNLEEGTEAKIMETADPTTALTAEIARRAEIEKRYATAGVINENVHPNFWQAYLRNLSNLAVLGSINLTLSYASRLINMRVLDQVMFKEDDTSGTKTASAEFLSGVYFISGITRTLQHRQFATTVRIAREAFNQLKGDKLTIPAKVVPPAPPVLTPEQTLIQQLKGMFPGKF